MNEMHAKSNVGIYVTVYFLLLGLVVLTIGAAHVKMGAFSFPVAMAIAGAKTVLIVSIFMHLKDELPLIRIFAYVGLLWLGIFFTFLMNDYVTRNNTRAIPSYTDLHGNSRANLPDVAHPAAAPAPAH